MRERTGDLIRAVRPRDRAEERLYRCAAGCALLGVVLLLTPGVTFTFFLCFEAAAGCLIWAWLRRSRSRTGIWCRRIALAGLITGLSVYAVSETVVLVHSVDDGTDLPADAVIVLGAGLDHGEPSTALLTRLERAAAYLDGHPGIPAVVSGGVGLGERISEGEAMARWFAEERPDLAGRIVPETRATSTGENYVCSRPLLEEAGIDTGTATIAVVTNGFHQFRAHLIARRLGLHTVGIPAEGLPWWVAIDCQIREGFALVKTFLFDWEAVIPDRGEA